MGKCAESPIAVLFRQIQHVGLLFLSLVLQILGKTIREHVFVFDLVLDNFVIFDFLFIDPADLVD